MLSFNECLLFSSKEQLQVFLFITISTQSNIIRSVLKRGGSEACAPFIFTLKMRELFYFPNLLPRRRKAEGGFLEGDERDFYVPLSRRL